MRRFILVTLLVASVLASVAQAQSGAPVPILPDSLRWVSPAGVSGLQAAWVLGAERNPGIYLLRVKLAAGARIPPHTHPDERNTTVLSGTIYVGFGATFDEANVVAVPAGAVYVAPANVPHYAWAKEGDAIYQECGVGPTGTVFVAR
jgi:quercetin dioxygenase-like cupin family protein